LLAKFIYCLILLRFVLEPMLLEGLLLLL